jgi:hypothetical protein
MKKARRRKHWNSAYENPRFREVLTRTRSVNAARMAASAIEPLQNMPFYEDAGYTLVIPSPTQEQATKVYELTTDKRFRCLMTGWGKFDMFVTFETDRHAFLFRMHYKGPVRPLI